MSCWYHRSAQKPKHSPPPRRRASTGFGGQHGPATGHAAMPLPAVPTRAHSIAAATKLKPRPRGPSSSQRQQRMLAVAVLGARVSISASPSGSGETERRGGGEWGGS
jgi:hypothetical protein